MEQSSLQRSRKASAQQSKVNSRDFFDDEEYDDVWPSRMPTSTRRYQSDVRGDVRFEVGHVPADVQSLPQSEFVSQHTGRRSSIPARRTAAHTVPPGLAPARRPAVETEDVISRRSGSLSAHSGNTLRFHWLVYAGLALMVMMVGWTLLSFVGNWWQVTMDDWHYGRPRTFQVDQVVGHNDSPAHPSHFIALNLNSHIVIIEFQGGDPSSDPSKVKRYVGPTLIGSGENLAPVTLSFKDVNGDGKLDMIVNVQNSQFVFINDGDSFRSPRPGEVIQP